MWNKTAGSSSNIICGEQLSFTENMLKEMFFIQNILFFAERIVEVCKMKLTRLKHLTKLDEVVEG